MTDRQDNARGEPREHRNEVPGDIADEARENLPGSLGSDDPDADPNATIDELIDFTVRDPVGGQFVATDQDSRYQRNQDGASVDPDDLLEGE